MQIKITGNAILHPLEFYKNKFFLQGHKEIGACALRWDCKNREGAVKKSQFLKKLYIELSYDLIMPVLGILPLVIARII